MQPLNVNRKCCFRNSLSLLVLIVLFFIQPGRCEEGTRVNAALRSRVYQFKNITSAQAQEMLSQLNIGKSYRVLSKEALLVTSDSGTDLIKATEFFLLVEQIAKPQLRVILTGDDVETVSLDDFLNTLEGMSPGTLLDAPPAGLKNPVIVDKVAGKLVAIAEQPVLDQLETALANYLAELASENAEPAMEDVDEAGIEQQAVEDAVSQVEPNQLQGQEEIFVPEPNLPSLEEIADKAFSVLVPDVNIPSEPMEMQGDEMLSERAATEENMTEEEDFFSDELLKALSDVEERALEDKAEASQEAARIADAEPAEPEAETVDAEQTESQPASNDPMAMLQALLARAEADKSPSEPETTEAEVTEESEPVEQQRPSKKVDPVQAELQYLRERIAELEAKTASEEQAGPDTDQSKVHVSTPVQTEPKLPEEELDTIVDLPQDVQLESLVDLVGKQLGLNYLYDPQILKGQTVKLKIHGGKIKVSEMYSLLETIFKMKNFAMTRDGNLVTIVKAPDAANVIREVDTVIRTPGEPIEAGDIVVTTLFQLENIDTNTAKTMLNSLNLGMKNGFQEVKETNTLMVTDYAYRMGRIEKILSIVDVPPEGTKKEYQFRTLKYMKPSEIVPKLKDLAGQLQGVSLQVSTGAGSAATTTQTRTVRTRDPQTGQIVTKQVPVTTAQAANPAAAAAKTPDDAVYIDTDDRTNRILIAGALEDIALVNELIDALDVPQYDLKTVREYIIQYVEATEVVDVLNELGLASVSVSAPAATSGRPTTPGRPATTTAAAATSTEQPYVSVRPATNSLLVNATEEQHRAIELVIAHVDVVQKDQRTIRQYEIQFVGAQDILDTLTDLGIITSESTQSTSRGRSNRTSNRTQNRNAARPAANQPQPGEAAAVPQSLPTVEGGSEVSITAEQPQISILETTNSLLVYATPRQHDAIALVIAHADRQLDATSTPYVVYALENQNPTDLAGVLNDIISQTVKEAAEGRTAGTSKVGTSSAAAASAGASNLPTLEEEKIRIIADEPSYSLIVYANKRNQQWIGELIKELDEYRPQVLLDCTLVEVTKDDEFKFELDLVAKTYPGTNLLPGTSGSLGGTGTTIGNLGGSSSFDPRQYAHASTGAGTFTGFFNSDMIQGLLTAMQKNEYGRVMARPKILVNDNQEGEIKTEDIQAVAQIKTIVNPGTATQTSTTSQDASFTDYTAGVTLTITPHISKGDMLRLEITLNRTDFGTTARTIPIADGAGGTTDVPYPPDRTTTDITTVSTVPDGTTIILGGLEKTKQSKTQSKVPILGDLPLIGGLFRDVSDTDTQGKLYVFVKANILRPSDQIEGLEDMHRVSGKYKAEFEDMEEKFQKMQDWPGVDPTPMRPEKVLEED